LCIDYHQLPVLKKNFGGDTLKVDGGIEAVVTRRLMTEAAD
jgi:hypothetical protein